MAEVQGDVVLTATLDISGVQAGYQKLIAFANDYKRQANEADKDIIRLRQAVLDTAGTKENAFYKNRLKQRQIDSADAKQSARDQLAYSEKFHQRLIELSTSQTRLEQSALETSRRNRATTAKSKLTIIEQELQAERLAANSRINAEKLVQDNIAKINRQAAAQRRQVAAEERRVNAQQAQSGGMFGGGRGSFFTSFGFGLMGAGRGIPGMRALGSLGVGYGFGQEAGLAGAAVGIGVSEAIRGMIELISLYEKLGRAAFDLTAGNYQLSQQFSGIKETIAVGFVPILTEIQNKEIEIFGAIDANKEVLKNFIADIGSLVSSISGFAEKLLLIATNSGTITEAIKKIGDAIHDVPANTPPWWQWAISPAASAGTMAAGIAASLRGIRPASAVQGTTVVLPPALPAGMNIPERPQFRQGQSVFQYENELQKARNQYIQIEIDLKKKSLQFTKDTAEGERIEVGNAEAIVKERKSWIEDQLKGFKDINDLEVRHQKNLAEDRDAEIAKIRINALKEEFEAKQKMLGIDLELIKSEGALAILKATGVGVPFTSALEAKSEASLKLQTIQAAGQRNIGDLEAKRAQAVAELGVQQRGLAGIPNTEAFLGDRKTQEKKIEDAQQAVEKANEEISLARLKNINDETKARLDGEAAVAAARKKDEDEELAANIKLIGEIQQIKIKAFQEEFALKRELETQLGRGGQYKISDILNRGAISPGTFRPLGEPGEKFDINGVPLGVSGVPTYTANLPEISQTSRLLADRQLSQNAIELLQTRKADLAVQQQGLEFELRIAQKEGQRKAIRQSIRDMKNQEIGIDQLLLESLQKQQADMVPYSAEWKNINKQINELLNSMDKLQTVSLTWGEKLVNTFEILAHHAGEFSASLGKGVGNVGSLMRGILDLRKVPLAGPHGGLDVSGQPIPSGSIIGGLKSAFSSPSNIMTEGIPLIGGIISAGMGIFTAIHDLFTRAAKRMAEAIGNEVERIVKTSSQTGKLNEAILALEAQRQKALSDLGSKKGGQKQLETLLPKIDDELASIKAHQKEIVDGFMQALSLLDESDPIAKLVTEFDALDKKVKEFINAAGESATTYQQAFAFIEKSAGKLAGQLQASIMDAWRSWFEGGENEQGQLISLDEQAIRTMVDNFKNYIKSVGYANLTQGQKDYYNQLLDQLGQVNELEEEGGSLEKQRAALTKANAKQEIDDLKKISDLKQQIVDLNDEEQKQIKGITDEGIAERQLTTQQDKAQRIADLQDKTQKSRVAMNEEIANIEDARAERLAAYLENIHNIDVEEQTLNTNFENSIQRINNELHRKRDAFLEKMNEYELEKEKILSLENEEGMAILRLQTVWQNSLNTNLAAYANFVDGIIDQNGRLVDSLNMAVDAAMTRALNEVAQRVQ